ncbi:LysR family transcriptional regulator [Niveispirillum irakense]|uniref:LysR family transcriptional regulator n=1 Tax=Niveispirillum irakense TaxID=34011 RepID=UPI000419C85D|nr:LysR family transcriptional regulator [Niveispirillum irakense]
MDIFLIRMTDISRLDLNLLKTLDALLTERSVTRTAARLGLTQPAVSGMLTRLRQQFSDPLFVRSQHGMVPTARATELATTLRRILADIETLLVPEQFDPVQANLTVTLAATDYALQAVIVPFVARVRVFAPGIRIAIQPVDDSRIQEQCERGTIDMALSTPEQAPPSLRSRHLFDEDYVCVMRQHHPDAGATPLSLDRFCALDHALVSYGGNRFQGVTDLALARLGRQRRTVLSLASFLALGDILRATDLIAVIPRRMATQMQNIVISEPPVVIPGFQKILVWHERTQHDPAQRWLRSLLADSCAIVPGHQSPHPSGPI